MHLVATKTIKAKVVSLTKHKKDLLETEYNNLQHFLQTGEDCGVYSANKQQALQLYKTIKSNKEYPISLRKDLIEIEKQDTCIAKYWYRIRVKGCRKLWVAIKPHQEIPENIEFCESKIIRRKKEFFVHLTVKKDVPKINPRNVLAVDLGERVIATVCGSFDNKKPHFFGRNIRGIRRHYSWLRRRLGEKKALKTIKKIKDTEKRKVDDQLNKISRRIVELAKEHNAMIVLGDLTGIQKQNKGRRMNRIVSNMPYFKLSQMIEYKAEWYGIPIIKIQEQDTSKICSRCNEFGARQTQGHFKCDNCGRINFNADYNGALNILKRAISFIDIAGVVSEPTQNRTEENLSSKII